MKLHSLRILFVCLATPSIFHAAEKKEVQSISDQIARYRAENFLTKLPVVACEFEEPDIVFTVVPEFSELIKFAVCGTIGELFEIDPEPNPSKRNNLKRAILHSWNQKKNKRANLDTTEISLDSQTVVRANEGEIMPADRNKKIELLKGTTKYPHQQYLPLCAHQAGKLHSTKEQKKRAYEAACGMLYC